MSKCWPVTRFTLDGSDENLLTKGPLAEVRAVKGIQERCHLNQKLISAKVDKGTECGTRA